MDTSTRGEQKRNRNGRVAVYGMNLNQQLVKQGWYWWYREVCAREYYPSGMMGGKMTAKARLESLRSMLGGPDKEPRRVLYIISIITAAA